MIEDVANAKVPLLFLCHRIPFPPNKGDKIRSFHLLKHLAKSFDIYLGTFVDDEHDWNFVAELDKYCRQRLVLPLSPRVAKIRSLKGFLTNQALSVPYYENSEMTAWVKEIVATQCIAHAIVYSSAMAQFIPSREFQFKRRLIDFVDIDSDKWRQYAEQKNWPVSYVFRREANKLLVLEKMLCEQFDSSLFVSHAEAELFKSLCPENASKVGYYNNGVDRDYFNPANSYANPYSIDAKVIVFTGAMDYWPNVDAVVWFARNIFPLLRAKHPQLQFCIVGGSPTASVLRLAEDAGVEVTGRVEDVRPYLQHAIAAVAPMRVARGVQNKVLEAMAMEKIVLVSSLGLEGIAAKHNEQLLVVGKPEEYGGYIERVIDGEFYQIKESARRFITSCFDWDENLPTVSALLNPVDRLTLEPSQGVAADVG
ncbi:MAG: sugar transferase (PEP-CTERM/EpsH1 system associated) [Halioglobus sp.]